MTSILPEGSDGNPPPPPEDEWIPLAEQSDLGSALGEALHDALCSCPENDAGTGFYIRSDDVQKALAKLLPVVHTYVASQTPRASQIPFEDEHAPYRYRLTGDTFCSRCGYGWPCPAAMSGDA